MKVFKSIAAIWIFIIFRGYSFAAIVFSTIEPDANAGFGAGAQSRDIMVDEDTLYKTLDTINYYLWVAIAVICFGVLIYGGFKLLSAQGEEKVLKEANNLILGAFVGIVIASMGFAVIKIVVNLF